MIFDHPYNADSARIGAVLADTSWLRRLFNLAPPSSLLCPRRSRGACQIGRCRVGYKPRIKICNPLGSAALLDRIISGAFNRSSGPQKVRIYRDVSERSGAAWPEEVRERCESADVVLVVIGPK